MIITRTSEAGSVTGRYRMRRLLSLWLVIWLIGCIVILAAFLGWSLLFDHGR